MKENNINTKTLISKNMRFYGTISSTGVVYVSGFVRGELDIEKTLFLDESGVIEGDIEASYIHIRGALSGNVQKADSVQLLRTAKVHADIRTKEFSVEKGTKLNGACIMLD